MRLSILRGGRGRRGRRFHIPLFCKMESILRIIRSHIPLLDDPGVNLTDLHVNSGITDRKNAKSVLLGQIAECGTTNLFRPSGG
jgi:hypothetical protein